MKSPQYVNFNDDPPEPNWGDLAKFPEEIKDQDPSWGEVINSDQYCFNTITDLLSLSEVKETIENSNVFISGKVGFFDQVIRALKRAYYPDAELKIIRTEKDLDAYNKKGKKTDLPESAIPNKQNEKHLPIILFPTVSDALSLNHLIAIAIKEEKPVWLVAIPSQIQPQLLLSFQCFFLSPVPKSGLEQFKGITPFEDEDESKNAKQENSKILFVANRAIEYVNEPNRLGTVVYIHDFGK